MPIKSAGYAAYDAESPIKPWQYELPDPRPRDVVVEVHYCGICHTDIHAARGRLFHAAYPLVTGHEFTGVVVARGSEANKHAIGARVGVCPCSDSCGDCDTCRAGEEQCCLHAVGVYGFKRADGIQTQGGYGRYVVLNERFAIPLPDELPMDKSAPLFCAGITVWTPMKRNGLDKGGQKVGIMGFGGLGHMAVKFAVAFGNEVWVLTRSPGKAVLAKELGAAGIIDTSDQAGMAHHIREFDYMLDTIAKKHDLQAYARLLKVGGLLQVIGHEFQDCEIPTTPLLVGRLRIEGSLTGSPSGTAEMLSFCAKNQILPMVEMATEDQINECWQRVESGDVRFRYVLDVKGSAPVIECDENKTIDN